MTKRIKFQSKRLEGGVLKFSIFKAYNVRGRYPQEIDEEIVFDITQSLGRYFKPGKIVVGHDSRLSSPSLYQAVLKGFMIHGLRFKILKVGMTTTPMFYFLVNEFRAQGGVMVTASHNPKNYNGLKVVGKKAKMIGGKEVLKIMNLKS